MAAASTTAALTSWVATKGALKAKSAACAAAAHAAAAAAATVSPESQSAQSSIRAFTMCAWCDVIGDAIRDAMHVAHI